MDPRWKKEHNAAFYQDSLHPGQEPAIAMMVRAWVSYAVAHKGACGYHIVDDGYAGEYWEDTGLNLLALLNCGAGRLDRGLLDSLIRKTLRDNGSEKSGL